LIDSGRYDGVYVAGGGRIDYAHPHAHAYGFSYGFGKGRHDLTARIIEEYGGGRGGDGKEGEEEEIYATYDDSDGLY